MRKMWIVSIAVASYFVSAEAQKPAYLEMSSNLKVHFIFADPTGRRAGADPRGTPADTTFKVTWLNEIPGADYSFSSEERVEDSTESEWIENTLFTYSPSLPDSISVFSVQVIGVDTGYYTIGAFFHLYAGDSSRSWGLGGNGVIEKDSTVNYRLKLCGLYALKPILTKAVNPRSLNQDIGAMRRLGWITTQPTADGYATLISNYSLALSNGNVAGARVSLGLILQRISTDSGSTLSADACKLLRPDIEYLISQLPSTVPSGLTVKLINSTGTKLTGGSLQYYDGSWKDATNNNDGTFSINTSLKTLSLRMTYEFATQTKSNVAVGYDTVAFQTVNAQVKLQNSQGVPIDTGSVQYYFSSWKTLGTTTNGVASKELLPGNYTFRMTYASATNDKQQDIAASPVVLFQTVNAAVQLKNSQGALMPAPLGDQGTVQYYFSSWRNFGVTTSGVATKELLPGNYTFRMTYAAATIDKQQNIGTNATVMFQTVNAAVQLKNSQGGFIDQGTVQYYFSSWNAFGSTTGGVATKELLPGNYTFRMSYASATNDKQQNIGTNPTVLFQTVNATVQLQSSLGSPLDQGTVQYYFSSWNSFDATTNGVAAKELLPGNYTFRMTYAAATNDKQQNIGTNPAVVFQTVNATVQLKNSQGGFIDQGTVQYYFSSWNSFGATTTGVATKELLPGNYTFRMTYESITNDKAQNLATSNTVSFSTVLCTVSVKNGQSQPVNNAQISYYFSSWKPIGPTVNGQVTKELLPANLTFRMTLGTATQNKTQNIGTNGLVEFTVQ